MALLRKVEAAIALGIGVELLEWFVKKCPKLGETRRLKAIKVGDEQMFDEAELDSFRAYLRAPWPLPEKGSRPRIPDKIKEDIKLEAHFSCAICGLMDNGEVAHIDAVAHSLNNSPENLIFLCPNHHTKFDLGYKPASNVTVEEIRAAKLVKRSSRARMLRVEADSAKALATLLDMIRKLGEQMEKADNTQLAKVFKTEAQNLFKQSSKLTAAATKLGASASTQTELQAQIKKHAPQLAKLISDGVTATSVSTVQTAIDEVINESADVLAALDEVECPHCAGRGTTGLIGDFCKFCHGAQLVSTEKANSYDPDTLDEVACPYCRGRGTIGLVGDYCSFCKGSQLVSQAHADSFDETALNEKPCPRCDGKGVTGLVGDYCAYCKGSCMVSLDMWKEYEPEDIDEVECPHCGGRGTVGLAGDECPYCRGSQLVSNAKSAAYDLSEIDEVDCPHCAGRGTRGLRGTYCSFCHGSQRVTSQKAATYDEESLGETECPHCEGHGVIGFNGDFCALCKGDQTVSEEKAEEYLAAKRRRRR